MLWQERKGWQECMCTQQVPLRTSYWRAYRKAGAAQPAAAVGGGGQGGQANPAAAAGVAGMHAQWPTGLPTRAVPVGNGCGLPQWEMVRGQKGQWAHTWGAEVPAWGVPPPRGEPGVYEEL